MKGEEKKLYWYVLYLYNSRGKQTGIFSIQFPCNWQKAVKVPGISLSEIIYFKPQKTNNYHYTTVVVLFCKNKNKKIDNCTFSNSNDLSLFIVTTNSQSFFAFRVWKPALLQSNELWPVCSTWPLYASTTIITFTFSVKCSYIPVGAPG